MNIENNIVRPALSETFKAVVAQYGAEELISKRQVASDEIVKSLSIRLKQYDLFTDSVSITSFNFSSGYLTAIENKQIAEQNVNKAKNDLLR